jgi:hypothetical protein
MKLKKINEKLREGLVENGITEAILLKKLFCFKSGADCVIISPKGREHNYCYQCDPAISVRENNRPAL